MMLIGSSMRNIINSSDDKKNLINLQSGIFLKKEDRFSIFKEVSCFF